MRTTFPGILLVAAWLTAGFSAAAGDTVDDMSSKPQPPRAILVRGTAPVVVPDENLRMALAHVVDERCPIELRCISAGHAIVTLVIEQDGQTPMTIVLGTAVLPEIGLRFDAEVGPYHIRLLRLEPRNSAVSKPALSEYIATVLMAKR